MIKQLQPPVVMDNVEVIAFDADNFLLHAVFHIYAGEPLIPDMQTNMKESVRKVVRYMETEGFLPSKMCWHINTGVVLHTSKRK